MANEVSIKVTSDEKRAVTGLKKVDDGVKDMRKTSFDATKIMGGLTRTLGILGIAGLSSVFSFKQLTETFKDLKVTSALAMLVLESLGPEFVASLEKIRPELQGIGEEFGFTASDLVEAFAIISKESRKPITDVDILRAAMGLARLETISLAEAARKLGKAELGLIGPLRDVTGEMGSLEEQQDRLIKRGLEATTFFDLLTGSFKNLKEAIVGGSGSMAKFLEGGLPAPFNGLVDAIGRLPGAINDIAGAIRGAQGQLDKGFNIVGNFFTLTLPDWWLAIKDFIGGAWSWELKVLGSFFTKTLPGWWENIKSFIGEDWKIGLSAVGNFFTKTLPRWWNAIVGWLGSSTQVTIDFFSRIDRWISRIWNWARNGIRVGVDFFSSGFNIPGFQTGGTVPGPSGAAQLAVVHGGETITPAGRQTGGGGGGGGGMGGIEVHIHGDLIVDNESRATEMADRVFRLLETKLRRGLAF